MKRILSSLVWIMLISAPTFSIAQQNREERANEQRKQKAREEAEVSRQRARTFRTAPGQPFMYPEMNGGRDIIIRSKVDSPNASLTIKIDGEKVIVNGKDITEFENDEIAVITRINPIISLNSSSPFRIQGYKMPSAPFATAEKTHGHLGVELGDNEKGAKINAVSKGSAAEKGGLKPEDIVIRFNDKTIRNAADLSAAVRESKPGDEAKLRLIRNGKEQELTVKLGASSSVFDFDFNFDFPTNLTFSRGPKLGIQAQDLEEGEGVKVLSVEKDSPAEKSGLQKDDIIKKFDGKEVKTVDDLLSASRDSRDKNSFEVNLQRGGKTQSLVIKIPKKLKTANL